MFRTRNYSLVVFGLIVGLFATGCESVEEMNSSGTYTSPKVKNGRLYFKNEAMFKATMDQLQEMPIEELIDWERNVGHHSLRTYNIENGDENTLDVPDSRFATILNENGVFQIGEEIHKITQQHEYILDEKEEKLLVSGLLENSDVAKHEIQFQQFELDSKETNANARGPWGWITKTNEFQSNRRVKWSGWNVTYVSYASCGVRSRVQKKNWVGWSDTSASKIGLRGSARMVKKVFGQNVGGYQNINFQVMNYNAGVAEKTLMHYAFPHATIDVSYINCLHECYYGSKYLEYYKVYK